MRREEFLALVQPRLFVGREDVDLRQFRANQIEVVASLDISFVDVYGIVGVEVDGPKDMGLRLAIWRLTVAELTLLERHPSTS